jgi:hypothetical protein
MISYKTKRLWHKWPGILFLLPSFIISVTAVLLALNGILKFDRVLLGWPVKNTSSGNIEIKSVVSASSGLFTGTKNGLYILNGDQIMNVEELSGYDIRSMATDGDTVWIASKQGLWKHNGDRVVNLMKTEVFGVNLLPGGHLLVGMGKKGYLITDLSGKETATGLPAYGATEAVFSSFASSQPYTLHKLIVDLHTGEALVGKTLKPWYIALTGLQMLILTVTGFWLLFKKKRNKLVKSVPAG